MRKLTTLLFALMMAFFVAFSAQAQDGDEMATDTAQEGDMAMGDDTTGMDEDTTAMADDTAGMADTEEDDMSAADMEEEAAVEEFTEPRQTFHEAVKEKFIEGGATFMTPVLLVLILGLAIAIERIIVLSLNTTNSKKLISEVEDALNRGGLSEAEKLVVGRRGPIASIFAQGIKRYEEGIEMVEKSIVSYGSVEMGKLERGLVWISLFIALAPMLGFLGTVIGMIEAFDNIQAAGDISPTVVAGGIKVALITTVAGLIVAIILQVFYNYLVSKIDGIVNNMEDASISFVDLLMKHRMAA